MDLLKLFGSQGEEDPASTHMLPGEQSVAEMQQGYSELIRGLLDDGGVAADAVRVEVRHVGRAADGREVFLGMLRVTRWDRKSALRVMLGQPLLDRLLRRLVHGSWLHDVSHFGGLWLHAASQIVDAEVMRELRELMQSVEQMEAGMSQPARESMWSVPPELESDPPPATPTPEN